MGAARRLKVGRYGSLSRKRSIRNIIFLIDLLREEDRVSSIVDHKDLIRGVK